MAEEGENVEQETNEDNIGGDGNLETSSSILAGLNLVLILSSLSSSDEEYLNLEEIQERERGNWNQKGKHSGFRSNFSTRRQEVNGFRAAERQMSKVNAKIRDCRHCRRL